MAVIVARTRNSVYVIDLADGRVVRHEDGGPSSTIQVSGLMSARPLCEADGRPFEESVIRGALGQTLVLMPGTEWRPVVGSSMVLRAGEGARILTTPVAFVSEMARAA